MNKDRCAYCKGTGGETGPTWVRSQTVPEDSVSAHQAAASEMIERLSLACEVAIDNITMMVTSATFILRKAARAISQGEWEKAEEMIAQSLYGLETIAEGITDTNRTRGPVQGHPEATVNGLLDDLKSLRDEQTTLATLLNVSPEGIEEEVRRLKGLCDGCPVPDSLVGLIDRLSKVLGCEVSPTAIEAEVGRHGVFTRKPLGNWQPLDEFQNKNIYHDRLTPEERDAFTEAIEKYTPQARHNATSGQAGAPTEASRLQVHR